MTIANFQHKPAKTVWVISDGVPGHFNQSKGILLALEQYYDLKVEWIEFYLKIGFYRRVLSWLLNRDSGVKDKTSIRLLSCFYRGKLPHTQPDIVIGAGGKSMFAVAWLGQVFAAKTIFAGSLRQLKSELFDAILIVEPATQAPFITLQTLPMPISQSLLKQAAQTWLETQRQTKQFQSGKSVWVMLIGGNGAGAKYQNNDWQILAQQMNRLAVQHKIQWLVTTSRRTGANAEQILRQYLDPTFVADAVWWSKTPRPVTSSYLGLGQVVCCTVDSMSMMMESVSAMRPVIAIIPQHFHPDSKFQNTLDRLQRQKLILPLEIACLAEKSESTNLITPLKTEPMLILANLLRHCLENS